MAAIETWQERAQRLEAALRLCMARAGHPDAAEGCRLVIGTARDALEGRPLPHDEGTRPAHLGKLAL